MTVAQIAQKNLLRQSFQLKKVTINQPSLDKFLDIIIVVLMQNNICNKYIQVAKLNYKLFLQFLMGIETALHGV